MLLLVVLFVGVNARVPCGEPPVCFCFPDSGTLKCRGENVTFLPVFPENIELIDDSDASILGDQTELQSVLSNLVVNAANHTDKDGKITIRWYTDEQGGHLSVTDTGIGIAPEDIPRVTERFFRVDTGRSRDKGGTGLGLAIVKHALNRHEAQLEIVSELGSGSTFICHFPPDRVG